MKAQISIFGARLDGHIARVSTALTNIGVKVVLLDPEFERSCALRFGKSVSQTSFLGIDFETGDEASTDKSSFFWIRNKKRYTHTLTKEEQQSQFTILEMSSAISAELKINGHRTHNDYNSVMFHENKGVQLSFAREIGLTIPETLISNRPESIRDFVDAARTDRFAIKALANVYIPPPFSDPDDEIVIYTQLVTRDDILSSPKDDFEGPPFILQEYVEKAFEVRLIMFDGELLSYAIESQADPVAKVDWRVSATEPHSYLIDTPDPIRTLCDRYLRRAGLNYGAFDFCVRPDGSWVFLECNSEGQWAWLESEDREISQLFARRFKILATGSAE
jgi:glutathione synthase/RimK-type ligase-like ATP-grasp enzyme